MCVSLYMCILVYCWICRGRVYGTAVSGDQIRHMCRVEGLEGHLCGARPWRRTALDALDSLNIDGDNSERKEDISVNSGQTNTTTADTARSHIHSSCGGGSKMIPVHWPQQACSLLSCTDPLCPHSHTLSDPTEIMNFEFFHAHNPTECSFKQTIRVTGDGSISGILVWWTLDLLSPELDPERTVSYSTEPGKQNWQDHWQQVIFPLPQDHPCSVGDEFELTSAHDGVHIWLELKPLKKRKLTEYQVASPLVQSPEAYFTPQLCECGWHILHNSERLQMLNDSRRMHAWEVGIQSLVNTLLREEASIHKRKARSILDLSDGSILALMAATAVRKHYHQLRRNQQSDKEGEGEEGGLEVLSLERKDFSHLFSTQLMAGNNLQDTLQVLDMDSWLDMKQEWVKHHQRTDNRVRYNSYLVLLWLYTRQ